MSAVQVQSRRGNAAAINSFTGAAGEVVVDTDNNRVVVQDGVTPGGFPAAKLSEVLGNSSATGIVANPGGGQSGATQLTKVINVVTVVATSGDSVKLPAAAPNLLAIVVNATSNPLQLYGLGTDTINGQPDTAGVAITAGKTGLYVAAATGAWNGGTLN